MIMPRCADAPTVSLRPADQEITVPIASDLDIVTACQRGRALASKLGYALMDATLIATVMVIQKTGRPADAGRVRRPWAPLHSGLDRRIVEVVMPEAIPH